MMPKDLLQPQFQGEWYAPQQEQQTARQPARTGLVIVPSSAGVTDVRERAYARFFAAHGMVCLIPDPFRMAGVTQCLTDQTAVSNAAMLSAARTAYEELAARTDVDRIGIMGVSKGGLTALHAAMRPMPMLPPWSKTFAFHVCLVPPASIRLRHPRVTGAPILMLLGGADDFTGATPAQDYARHILAANPNLRLDCRVMEGAHHAWESRGAVRFLPDAERYAHCLFYLEDDGSYTEAHSGTRFTPQDFRQHLRNYTTHGAHVGGGTDELFEKTCHSILDFITETA